MNLEDGEREIGATSDTEVAVPSGKAVVAASEQGVPRAADSSALAVLASTAATQPTTAAPSSEISPEEFSQLLNKLQAQQRIDRSSLLLEERSWFRLIPSPEAAWTDEMRREQRQREEAKREADRLALLHEAAVAVLAAQGEAMVGQSEIHHEAILQEEAIRTKELERSQLEARQAEEALLREIFDEVVSAELIERSSLLLEERSYFVLFEKRKALGLAYEDDETRGEKNQKEWNEREMATKCKRRHEIETSRQIDSYVQASIPNREATLKLWDVVEKRRQMRQQRWNLEEQELAARVTIDKDEGGEFFADVCCRFTHLHMQVFDAEETCHRQDLLEDWQREGQLHYAMYVGLRKKFQALENDHFESARSLFVAEEELLVKRRKAEVNTFVVSLLDELLTEVHCRHVLTEASSEDDRNELLASEVLQLRSATCDHNDASNKSYQEAQVPLPKGVVAKGVRFPEFV